MSSKAAYSVLLLALAAAQAAAAVVSEDLFLADMPRVLTASRIGQSPLDAPAPVSVIDRETIRASGFTEIHDLLRLVPGFLVADWPTGSPVVTNHAMGNGYPHNLLVLLDGRSVVDPVTGSVDWLDLPVRVHDIERIEVVRGPNQASYGAAAFNGVVNIISRVPGEEVGHELVWSAGQRGFSDKYVRYGRRGDAVDWQVSLSDRKANPFRDLNTPYYWRNETNDRQNLRADATWHPKAGREFDLNLGLVHGKDWVGSTHFVNTDPYHAIGTDNRFLQLAWRESHDSGAESSLRYYHYDHERRNSYVYVTGSQPVPLNLGIQTRRDDLEFQQTRQLAGQLIGVWGLGVRRDAVESDHYFFRKGEVSGVQWQAFGNLDWRAAPNWLMHAGAMVEKPYNADALLSPRLALNYTIAPGQILRASAGRGYRAPNRLESDAYEVFTLGGTPFKLGLLGFDRVEPERVDFVEFGYFGRIPAYRLQLDARAYAEKYERLIMSTSCWMNSTTKTPACIVAPPADYVALLGAYKAYDYENTGGARVLGGELALDWRHDLLGRIRLAHAITQVRADANTNDDIPKSAPSHSTSLLWSKDLPWGLSASLGYYRVGAYYWLGDGDRQSAYERVDARLAKQFGKPGGGNEIAVTARSLNGRYFEFTQTATANYTERQAFVTLRLGW